MATSPSSAGGSNPGLIPNTTVQASPPNTEKQGSSARTVGPDVASPTIKPNDESAGEQVRRERQIPETNQPHESTTTPGQHAKTSPKTTAERPWPEVDCSRSDMKAEAANTERMKAKYGAPLVDDMDDTQLLLSYITRNGLQEDRKVTDDTIKTLIKAGHRLRTGVFDCENEEPQFRKDYGIIAKAAAPVTVASLRDSLPTPPQPRWTRMMEGEPRSLAERKCFNYRDTAFGVLLLLLFCQIYWTMASSVLTKTDALISELNSKFPTKEWYLEQHAASLRALQTANQPSTAEAAPPKPAPPPAAPPSTTATETKENKPPATAANETRESKPPPTRDELVTKIAELNTNYVMLNGLLRPVAYVFFHRLLPDFNLVPATKDEAKAQENSPASKAADSRDIFDPTPFQTQSATVCAVGRQVIDIMQKWLLPLLYGALGALVFVVRTLSNQARDRLFRKEAVVSLNLRVYLGIISGLAIGWFWGQGPSTPGTAGPMSLTTLSPFALAFIAGYGVEIFFALLDKLIAAFTNK